MESNISVTAFGINSDWKMVNFMLTTEIMDECHTSINLEDKLIGIMRECDICI